MNDDRAVLLESLGRYYQDEARQLMRRDANAHGAFSVLRALNAIREHDFRNLAPIEFDASERLARELERRPRPGHVFVELRDLSAAGAPALVSAAGTPGRLFIDRLRAVSITGAFNVEMLAVKDNVTLPVDTGGASAQWLATEATQISESGKTFAGVFVSPKHVGCYIEVSDRLLRQTTPEGEAFLMRALADDLAEGVDAGLIAGDGVGGAPVGILNASGVGSVPGTGFDWADARAMQRTVEAANGIASPSTTGWAVAPDVAEILRGREKSAGSGFIMADGRIGDFRAVVSKSVPSGTLLFGDWSGAVLPAWSALEVGTDPFGAGGALFKTAVVGVRAIWTLDVAVTRPASFCKATSIT